MPQANPRSEIGAHRYQCPLQHPMITKKLGEEKIRGCLHFLPVASLFGSHIFFSQKELLIDIT